MLEAEKGQVVKRVVGRVLVQVRDLTTLLGKIGVKPETEGTSTPALG
jgi:hypothetical protein